MDDQITNLSSKFSRSVLTKCQKSPKLGSDLNKLFEQKSEYGFQKIKLADLLIDLMLSPELKKIENRPIVKVLKRVAKLALRNPFPTTQEIWERNQASTYLGKNRN